MTAHMNPMLIFNAVTRRLSSMFPGYFPAAKHNHYADFSYPEELTFALLYQMWTRNGLAHAGVAKTVDKVWQTMPRILEREESHEETPLERGIRQHLESIRGWQKMKQANTRALVGGWSGLILRVEDGQPFEAPLDVRKRDITHLAGLIPVWADQLTVTAWDTDALSPTYGEPTLYSFNEAEVGGVNAKPARSVPIHPDRVVIWSQDGLPEGESLLKPGYNDLLDIEKISGSGGEAFWKNAKGGAVLEVDPEVQIEAMMRAMGADTPDQMLEAMNDQMEAYNRGFDKVLMLQGMKRNTDTIALPSPEHFRLGSVENFAASIGMPVKVLVGMQTGERASLEDGREWAQTCMARRAELTHPSIRALVERLETFGLLPESDWYLDHEDLTEATAEQKIGNAKSLSDINRAAAELVFTPDEIREAAGYQPLTEAQKAEYEAGEDADPDEDTLEDEGVDDQPDEET